MVLGNKFSQQSDIIPITKLISKFRGYEGVDYNFSILAGTDVLAGNRHIRTKVQLIEVESRRHLTAFQRSEEPPRMILKNSLGQYPPL